MRFLIVDDIEINCRVMARLLGRYGECDTATDARKALHLFQGAWKADNPYTALFLDIMMPDVNGLQLLQVLRELENRLNIVPAKRIRTVVVTSSEDSSIRIRARDMGAEAIIAKPVDTNELTRCVESLKHPRKTEPDK